MATQTATVQLGSKLQSGAHNVVINSGTAHVTLSFDDTVIKTKGDLRDACNAMIEHISSGLLK
jgi:hypothetical protein